MRKLLLILLSLFLLAGCATRVEKQPEELALERAAEYKEVFNRGGKDPSAIYDYLCQSCKDRISRDEFVAAYNKDRSYPYITPLYIFEPVVELSADGLTGSVTYQQAARIVGMTWKTEIVFENGNYYFRDFEYLIDGSYLEKFKDIPYSLDWYYDL